MFEAGTVRERSRLSLKTSITVVERRLAGMDVGLDQLGRYDPHRLDVAAAIDAQCGRQRGATRCCAIVRYRLPIRLYGIAFVLHLKRTIIEIWRDRRKQGLDQPTATLVGLDNTLAIRRSRTA